MLFLIEVKEYLALINYVLTQKQDSFSLISSATAPPTFSLPLPNAGEAIVDTFLGNQLFILICIFF
jgi:hypothetical protein